MQKESGKIINYLEYLKRDINIDQMKGRFKIMGKSKFV